MTTTEATTETDRPRTSEFAIASLTLGIGTFINLLGMERAIPAIVFGLLGLRRVKADDRLKGKGMAVAGVVLGVIGVIVLPVLGLMFLPEFYSLVAGTRGGAVVLEDNPDPAGAVVQIGKSLEAFESAQAWLELVDSGEYAQAWLASASANRDAVTKESMVETYNGFRGTMGDVASRKLKSARYTTSLSDAPPGEYVVIEFNTTFADNRRFLERVTPMLEEDGTWKVSGYYLLK